MTHIKRIILILFSLLLALLLISCGTEPPSPPTPPTPQPLATRLVGAQSNELGCVIVCDKSDNAAMRRAMQVRAAINVATGTALDVEDEATEHTYEIVIMDTSRDISGDLKAQVTDSGEADDLLWGFAFDGKRFAIYANGEEAWGRCMKELNARFLADGTLTVKRTDKLLLGRVSAEDYALELLRKDTHLDPIFGDHMVLQRDCEVRLYGTGIGHVSVEFLGNTYEGVTEGNTFTVTLPPTPAGGPYELKIDIEGTQTVLKDVLFGEVILLAGQSNAELPLNQTDTPALEYASNDRVRTFFVGQYFTDEFHYETPLDNRWAPLLKGEAGRWCAIAYHLGRKLEADHDVPVGVICVVRGATVIQSFMSPEVAAEFPFEPEELSSSHPCNTTVDRYKCFNQPGMMYKLFKKVAPYTVGSAVWYQGESNDGPGESLVYDQLLAAMIELWRTDLENEELPFLIVKLHDRSQRSGWLAVREAQVRAAESIPHCTLVDLDSLGVCSDIHPKNKEAVCGLIYDAYYAALFNAQDQ